MAKKKTVKKTASEKSILSSVDPLVDYGRDVWLAGLGAFSLAQQEGGKLGGKVLAKGGQLFDQLVQEGSKLEQNTRKSVGTAGGDIRGGIESSVERVRKTAVNNWDRLENVFEERVARALGRLGIPTADEIQELIGQVNKLNREVRLLNSKPTTSKSETKTASNTNKSKSGKKTAKKTAKKAA